MSIIGSALRWGILLGLIGFCGGFFGPMIFMPDANQAPLVGILISGPLGFLIGLVFGAIRAILGSNW